MNVEEFRMAVTHALAHRQGAAFDAAILWLDGSPCKVQMAGKVVAAHTHMALPVVRLLRTLEARPEGDAFITTTAEPTEACLGMARMCGIRYIAYLKQGVLKKVTTKRKTTNVSTVAMGPGDYPNVPRAGSRARLAWTGQPALHAEPLGDWLDDCARSRQAYGKLCEDLLQLPVLHAPPVVRFVPSGLEYLGLKSMVGDQGVVDNVFMMLAWEMVARVSGFQTDNKGDVTPRADARSAQSAGHNIGSLLADAEGNVVAWAFNTNKNNPTRHGEMNLIISYLVTENAPALPVGGTLYSTLEPCEMCSGAIHRTVTDGAAFRVVYGQKDVNVYATALQRQLKPAIKMTSSGAKLATQDMIKDGSARSAVTLLTDKLRSEQDTLIVGNKKFNRTTVFLKEKSTYESFFGHARPQWWLYLWDHMAAKLPPRDFSNDPDSRDLQKELADPAVMKLNNQLDIIYRLVEQFMKTVCAQAKS
jgi:tRNA(Arg) A34 adenosine deaminase TadA